MRDVSGLVLLAITLLSGVPSFADDQLPTLAEKTAAIVDRYGLSRTATVHLGALPKATRGVIAIKLTNDTAETIRIERVQSSCGCLSARVAGTSIDPGNAADFSFVLETPRNAAHQEVSVSAALVAPDGRDVRLGMRYVIEGALAVESPISVVEVKTDDAIQRFEIPILFTAPVEPKQMRFAVDEQLQPIVFSIGQDDKRAWLVGEFPLEAVENEGLSGRVTLSHAGAEHDLPVEIVVRRASPVTLSPSIITMRRDGEGGRFVGSAILHVRGGESAAHAASSGALVDGSVEGADVELVIKRLGEGIYKTTVRCDPPEEWLRERRHKSVEMNVQIRSLGKTFESVNALRFIE